MLDASISPRDVFIVVLALLIAGVLGVGLGFAGFQ